MLPVFGFPCLRVEIVVRGNFDWLLVLDNALPIPKGDSEPTTTPLRRRGRAASFSGDLDNEEDDVKYHNSHLKGASKKYQRKMKTKIRS